MIGAIASYFGAGVLRSSMWWSSQLWVEVVVLWIEVDQRILGFKNKELTFGEGRTRFLRKKTDMKDIFV